MGVATDWRVRLGIVLGLAGAAALVAVPRRPPAPSVPAHGPLLSDCDGALEELVVHWVPEAAGIAEVAYRQFLGQLPPQTTVHVVCPDRAAFADLRSRLGPLSCRLVPVCTGHPITCWSRDRWLALAPAEGGPAVLLAPASEEGAAVWPQRAGDARVAAALAAAQPRRVAWARSGLDFDGGDFVADARTAFVTPDVLRRNLGRAVASPAELRDGLAAVLGRRVVLLEEAPPHHAGMFLMLAGEGRAVVGDPAMARRLLEAVARSRGRPAGCPLAEPDFSASTQRLFDAVARPCAEHGYRVSRIPVVPGRDERTYLTYLNAILDQRGGRRTVYMPVYAGAECLNDAAAATWQSLGYAVRRVDCSAAYAHYGSLRCLVNVLRRSQPGGAPLAR